MQQDLGGQASALLARKVDAALARYVEVGANARLKLLLFVAVLSALSIGTTSFAALLAAFGVAIGAAASYATPDRRFAIWVL